MAQNLQAPRIRVLPLTILFLFLVLLLRVGTFVQEYYFFRINSAYAAETKKEVPAKETQKEKASPKKEMPQKETAADGHPTAPSEGEEKPEDKVIEEVLSFSGVQELEIIQDILKVKKGLEEKKRQIDSQETVLKALKQQITEQAQKLEQAQKKQQAQNKGNKEQDKKFEEVSKTYGSMKAPEAAKILSQLNPDYAIKILSKMSAAKKAPIIAAMPDKKAKDLTERMIQ